MGKGILESEYSDWYDCKMMLGQEIENGALRVDVALTSWVEVKGTGAIVR